MKQPPKVPRNHPKLFFSARTCDEHNNPVAKKSPYTENLRHYYFLVTGLFCSPRALQVSDCIMEIAELKLNSLTEQL